MRHVFSVVLASSISHGLSTAGEAASLRTSPETTASHASERFPTARALLDALESAGRDIETLRCTIVYRKLFAIQSDEQYRQGTLYYESAKTPEEDAQANSVRRFAVSFESLIVGDRREKIDQHYIFDGQWVVEKTPSDKQFTKRQVVPPGETFDPLRIGEGPFPIPIGQRTDDILARFDADLRPPAEGLKAEALVNMATKYGFHQLRLLPKPGTNEADDFKEIRIWYEPSDRLLPRIALTVNPAGDESEIVLFKPVLNEPVVASLFSTETPPADEGWHVSISEYREPVDG